jgi:signal transduction histidine kinase/CHASE3 domain sensor protein
MRGDTFESGLRRFVFTLAALGLLVFVGIGGFIALSAAELERLSAVEMPAVRANTRVPLAVQGADRALMAYGLTGDVEALQRYQAARQRSVEGQARLHLLLRDAPPQVRALLGQQERALADWWSYADARLRALEQGKAVGQGGGQPLVEQVRAANTELDSRLRQRSDAAHRALQEKLRLTLAALAVALVAALVATYVLGYPMVRSMTRPLADLQAVVRGNRRTSAALADPSVGPLEVRSLAEDFNELTAAHRQLRQEQARVLRMQHVALEVAEVAGSRLDTGELVGRVCLKVQQALAADRVRIHVVDRRDGIAHLEDRHRPGLQALPRAPHDLRSRVPAFAADLGAERRIIVAPEFPGEQFQDDDLMQALHRYSGARALLLAPISAADEALGFLTVYMHDGPREWNRQEVEMVRQACFYLGQAIMEGRFTALREREVRRLSRLDEEKNDFLGTVSHELRTPLASIAGYLELLQDGDLGPVSTSQEGALAVVSRNAGRLRDLIEDLLMLNRVQSAGLESSKDRVPVNHLVGAAVEVLRPHADEREVALDVPEAPGDLCVRGDRAQLERALMNLGANAVKFSPRGGRVQILALAHGDMVGISVSDEGIGIPAADLDRLSERFFRASNATEQSIPGTGLGLAIVREVVEAHDGDMQVFSEEDKGTTMRLLLPRWRDRASGETLPGLTLEGGSDGD